MFLAFLITVVLVLPNSVLLYWFLSYKLVQSSVYVNVPLSTYNKCMSQFGQLYMESIHDLLNPVNDNISIVEDPKTGDVSLPGATLVEISGQQSFMELLRIGEAHRIAANTKLNTESSRSHAILMVNHLDAFLNNVCMCMFIFVHSYSVLLFFACVLSFWAIC